MLALSGIDKSKMDAHRIGSIFWAQPECVIAQVFARLNIVLIVIGPVELDFFAFIRNSVHTGFIDSLRKKITFGVVAPEKTVKMVIDLALKRTGIHRNRVQLFFKFLNLGRLFRIRKSKLPCLVDRMRILRFKLAFVCSFVLRKGRLYLR